MIICGYLLCENDPPQKYEWSFFSMPMLQLRGNQKDVNFQLHHRLSKFEVPVVVNLKHIFEFFGHYDTCFLIQKLLELIRSSSDGQFWRKSQNKKGGKFELRLQLCYYNCTFFFALVSKMWLKQKIKAFRVIVLYEQP